MLGKGISQIGRNWADSVTNKSFADAGTGGLPAAKIFSSKNFAWAPPRDFLKQKITDPHKGDEASSGVRISTHDM